MTDRGPLLRPGAVLVLPLWQRESRPGGRPAGGAALVSPGPVRPAGASPWTASGPPGGEPMAKPPLGEPI